MDPAKVVRKQHQSLSVGLGLPVGRGPITVDAFRGCTRQRWLLRLCYIQSDSETAVSTDYLTTYRKPGVKKDSCCWQASYLRDLYTRKGNLNLPLINHLEQGQHRCVHSQGWPSNRFIKYRTLLTPSRTRQPDAFLISNCHLSRHFLSSEMGLRLRERIQQSLCPLRQQEIIITDLPDQWRSGRCKKVLLSP